MPDIVINPSLGKIDFFTVKGDQASTNSMLLSASVILFNGPISASSISAGGAGAFVTTAQSTSNYLTKFTNTSSIGNSLVYDDGTNVGIGTSSPSVKLAVEGGSIATVNITGSDVKYSFDIRALVGGAIGFNNAAASNVYGAVTGSAYFGVAQSYPIVFTTAGTERLRIASGGSVGIGTTTVNQKLSIYPGTTGGISLQDSDGGTRSYFFIDNTNPTYSTGIRTNNYYLDFDSSGASQNAIRFYTGTSTIGTGTERMRILSDGNVGIGTSSPSAKLQVAGNISGSSFTSSISNAVGFLGTSSWAQNVVSASFATTAQTANALNTANNYQVNSIGVGIAGSGTAGRIGMNEAGIRSWSITPTGGRLVIEAGDGLGSAIFSCPLTSSNFVGPGTGLTGTAASLTAGTANALNTANSYTIAGLTVNGNISASGTISASKLQVVGTANVIELVQATSGSATYYVMDNTVETGGRRYRFGYSGASADKGSFTIYNATDNITPFTILTSGSVGIGTTAPTARLHVTGSTGGVFEVDTAGGATTLYVSASGNVGIGTTNPIYKFQVVGSAYVNNGTLFIDSGNTLNWGNSTQYILGTNDVGLSFVAGSATRMFISSSGNVGIGSSSPSAKLDIRQTSAATGLKVFTNDTSTSYIAQFIGYDNSLGDTTRMVVQAGGNVGIGTSSPAYLLDVSGSSRHGYRTADNHYFTGSVNISGSLNATASWANNVLTASSLVAANSYTITNLTASNISASGTSSFGYVGIGTTLPSAKLTIVENTNGGTINLVGRTSDDTAAINFRANGDASTYAYVSPDTNEFRLYHNDGFMSFYPGGSEKVRITSTGNVGIGTTSPDSKLKVFGTNVNDGSAYYTMNLLNTANAVSGVGSGLMFGTNIGTASGIYINAMSGIEGIKENGTNNDYASALKFTTRINGGSLTERVRIDSVGNVGIGTSSPVAKLDVAGNSKLGASISNTHQITGSLSITGSVSGINTESFHPFLLG
jgi:hypothetical protein